MSGVLLLLLDRTECIGCATLGTRERDKETRETRRRTETKERAEERQDGMTKQRDDTCCDQREEECFICVR